MFAARNMTFAGARFNPLSLSPALWLDFSDASTLFDAAIGGSTPTNGNDVGRAEDKSGNARHFTQGTAAKCPHYQSSVQNGLSIARFDGVDDTLLGNAATLNILRNKAGGSIIMVYKWVALPTSTLSAINISRGSDDLTRLGIVGLSSLKANIGGRRLDSDGGVGVTSSGNVPSVFFSHAGIVSYQDRTLRQYFNNALDGSFDTFQTAGNSADTNSFSVAVGSNQSGQFSNIDIAEIIAFDRAISDADRNTLHNYLSAKWGI